MKENHKVDELLGNIAKLKSAIDEKDEIIVGLAKSKEEDDEMIRGLIKSKEKDDEIVKGLKELIRYYKEDLSLAYDKKLEEKDSQISELKKELDENKKNT